MAGQQRENGFKRRISLPDAGEGPKIDPQIHQQSSQLMSDLLIKTLSPFTLVLDKEFEVLSLSGNPYQYGYLPCEHSCDAREQFPFLYALEPTEDLDLQFVETPNHMAVHVYIRYDLTHDVTRIFFLDATQERDRARELQQIANNVSIAHHRLQQVSDALQVANKELDNKTQALEKASELKTRFIATLSHEFRTPLSSIIGYAEWVKNQSDDERLQEPLLAIERNVRQLVNLIDNVLDQATIEHESLPLEPSAICLAELFDDIRVLFLPLASKKGLQFTLRLTGNFPDRVWMDGLRFRQVLINLIGNAVKFTQQGEIQLKGHWHQDRLTFSIEDSGKGIAEEQLPHIFTPFERAGEHKASGAGLGLSIAKHITERMGGDLKVSSTVNVGTVFDGYVQAPSDYQALDITEATEAVENPRKQVLIAEDNPDILELMRLYLESDHSIDLLLAQDGQEAIDIAQDSVVDLVVLDMYMPKLNGPNVAHRLRRMNISVPIVMLSASKSERDKQLAFDAGCDEYLLKPIEMDEFCRFVHKKLGL